jgi:hypothetical protein
MPGVKLTSDARQKTGAVNVEAASLVFAKQEAWMPLVEQLRKHVGGTHLPTRRSEYTIPITLKLQD